MEWLIAFAAGTAAGLAVWPLIRVLSQAPGRNRDPISHLRFRRAFGIAPSRDPDIHKLLQPTVDKHLSYLREAAGHAKKDLGRWQAGDARSLITASHTAARLRRTKKRLTKVTKQLAEATALALAWNFVVDESARAQRNERAVAPPPQPQRAVRRRRTAVAAASSRDGTPATN